jgi:hypothetical protein
MSLSQLQINCLHEIINEYLIRGEINHTNAYILDFLISKPLHRFEVMDLAYHCGVSRAVMFRQLALFKQLGLLTYTKYHTIGSTNKRIYKFKAGTKLIRQFNSKMQFIEKILDVHKEEIKSKTGREIGSKRIEIDTVIRNPDDPNMQKKYSNETVEIHKNPSKRVKLGPNRLISESRSIRPGYIYSSSMDNISKNKNKDSKINSKINKRAPKLNELLYQSVIDDMNEVGRLTKAKFRLIPDTIKLIKALFESGYTLDDFKAAHRGIHSTSQVWYLKRGLYNPQFLYQPKNFEKFTVLSVSEQEAEDVENDVTRISDKELAKKIVDKTASSEEIDEYWRRAPKRRKEEEIEKERIRKHFGVKKPKPIHTF